MSVGERMREEESVVVVVVAKKSPRRANAKNKESSPNSSEPKSPHNSKSFPLFLSLSPTSITPT